MQCCGSVGMGLLWVRAVCFQLEVAKICDDKTVDCWTLLKLELLGVKSSASP